VPRVDTLQKIVVFGWIAVCFLRGLTVNYEALTSSAMCTSTHLTTMGMVGNSQFSQTVQEPNWFVIGICAGVAGGFVLIIQQGALSRPFVVGAGGSEAILRGWLSAKAAKEVVLMGLLHIVSGNPFNDLFFHRHADIVYSRAHKATRLFAGLFINVHIDRTLG